MSQNERSQIVIDTNVLIAGLRSKRGASFMVLSLVGTGRFDIHLSVIQTCKNLLF
jgi:predicted nucleic acid-binding protein